MTLGDKLDEYNKGVSAWLDQAKRATAAIHRLERAVATGNVRDVERLRQAARTAVQNAAQRGEECPAFDFDPEAYLKDREGFIQELIQAAERKIDAYIDQPLTRIYEVLTLLPGSDYTLLDFTRDIYFLDTSDVRKTRKGYHMSLPASTVSREKSGRVLRFVTRDGYEKDYASIRLTPPHPGD